MKAFAINLDSQPHKKEHILAEAQKHGLDAERISAVYGKELTKAQLSEMVVDHEHNFLTKGEIGCALSHIKAYKKMIDENIPIALVLEDDAVLFGDVATLSADIEKLDDAAKPNVYLLTAVSQYYRLPKYSLGSTKIHKVYRSNDACCYIINNAAAQLLYDKLYPVWLEADVWHSFIILFGLNVHCTFPIVAKSMDENKEQSTLEAERLKLGTQRAAYYRQLLKAQPWYSIKDFLRRGFARPFAARYK